jgi:hypothetical protein
VHHPPRARSKRRLQDVSRPVDGHGASLGRATVVSEGAVDHDLAALRGLAHRMAVGQVGSCELHRMARDALGSGELAEQGAHARLPLRGEPLHDPAADESRGPGDEDGRHVATRSPAGFSHGWISGSRSW